MKKKKNMSFCFLFIKAQILLDTAIYESNAIFIITCQVLHYMLKMLTSNKTDQGLCPRRAGVHTKRDDIT